MKTITRLFFALLVSTTVSADPIMVTNPYLPYPPACGRLPDMQAAGGVEAQATRFFQRELRFFESQTGDEIPLTLRAYRAPCSEPARSLIWLEFTLAARYTATYAEIQLPTVAAEIAPNHRILMNLAAEPNGWGANGWVDREATYLLSQPRGFGAHDGAPAGDRRWVFLLDNGPPLPDEFYENGLTPDQYNAAFKLVLRYNPYDRFVFDVPATVDMMQGAQPTMPLSGRLSGNWVTAGAADQGILLSISERVLPQGANTASVPAMPMVLFLAHYTYNHSGNLLWLTGAAHFEAGARQVTLPVELVTDGQFRGPKQAQREIIGSITLRSRSCNNIDFEFDYYRLGLGRGELNLQRPFSLELAGHECRDHEARMAANRE